MSEPISNEEARAVDLADRLGLPQASLFGSVSEVILHVRTRLDSAITRSERDKAALDGARDALQEVVARLDKAEAEVTSLHRKLEAMTTDRDYHRDQESRLRGAVWEWGLSEPVDSEIRNRASAILFPALIEEESS